MTTPTGQIAFSQIRLEIYGSATGQISLLDANVRTLSGDATGAVSTADCKGKTWGGGGAGYSPTPGTYTVDDGISAEQSFTVTHSGGNVTWTWTITGNAGWSVTNSSTGATATSGGSYPGITFDLVTTAQTDKSTTMTLSSGGNTWTITLDVYGTNNMSLSTMTL